MTDCIDIDDLIKRLTSVAEADRAAGYRLAQVRVNRLIEARDALASQQEQIRLLRKALKPFAAMLAEWEEDGDTPPLPRDYCEMNVPVPALRRAALILKQTESSDG